MYPVERIDNGIINFFDKDVVVIFYLFFIVYFIFLLKINIIFKLLEISTFEI